MAVHVLGCLDNEVKVQMADGVPARLCCISLLMTACRYGPVADISPKEMAHLFKLTLANYTSDEEDGT